MIISSASRQEMLDFYGIALVTFWREELSSDPGCLTIGCVTWDQLEKAFDEISLTPEYVYILYVSFIIRRGPEEETATHEIVSRMTNFIKENCFEISVDGMNIKFTSLQERNIYNDSMIKDWCKDGDLGTFVTGEFDVITVTEGESLIREGVSYYH